MDKLVAKALFQISIRITVRRMIKKLQEAMKVQTNNPFILNVIVAQ